MLGETSFSVGGSSITRHRLRWMKFWRQMVIFAEPTYPYSTNWPHPQGERDALVETLGDVGNWQFIVVLLMMMFNIPIVFHVASPEVVASYHDYWCERPTHKLTLSEWRELSDVKIFNFKGEEVHDPCLIKDLPYDDLPFEELRNLSAATQKTRPCTVWSYNMSSETVISQYNLACYVLPVNNVAESAFSIGGAIGGLLNAYLSDRYGRRQLLMVSQGFVVFIGFVSAHVPTYNAFLFCRALLGFACSAVLLCSFVLCLEISNGKWRGILTTVYMYSYSLAYVALYLFNTLFDSWIYLQFSITLIAVFLLSIWWLVPESPRWLLTTQKLPKLMIILETANSFNHKPLVAGTTNLIKNMAPMRVYPRKANMAMIFREGVLRRVTIVTSLSSFFFMLAYYGLVLNTDLFTSGLLYSGILEFAACTVVLILCIRDDVKMVIIASTMSGIFCLIGAGLTRIASAGLYLEAACMFSRFFGGMMNACLTTIITSMYPTECRTMGMGFSNFFNNLSQAVGANLVLLGKLYTFLPLIILGLSSLLGSFFFLFLPGRTSRDLHDLVEETDYAHEMTAQLRAVQRSSVSSLTPGGKKKKTSRAPIIGPWEPSAGGSKKVGAGKGLEEKTSVASNLDSQDRESFESDDDVNMGFGMRTT